jgi:hypothetical protein
VISVDLVSARAFFLLLHARLRVHRASGIPCALFYRRREKFLQNSGAWRREIAEARSVVVTRHRVGAFPPPDDRLLRVIQYSRDIGD